MLSAEPHTPVFSRPRRTRSCLACMHNPLHAVMTGLIPLGCNPLNSCVVAEVCSKIKVTGVFTLINIQPMQLKNFVKELDGPTCQEFSRQSIHILHYRVLPADHRQSHRESVLLRMLHLAEFFLHHGYVISFDSDNTHSSCLQ